MSSMKMAGNNTDDDYESLQYQQRLKAALHYTTMKICQQQSSELDVVCTKQLVASISETAWRQCQKFAEDMEMFTKHAKRTTVNADDIKMLTRRSGSLHKYISGVHEKLNENKQDGKKQKKSKKKAGTSSTTVTMETDEESNM